MTDTEDRLVKCFQLVFPGLTPEAARAAEVESLESWDSIATANLLTLLEEEFGVNVDYELAGGFTSFAAIRSYIEAALRTA
jgi:acyl carrier protein